MRIRGYLSAEGLGLLGTFRIGPAGKPALTFPPPVIMLAAASAENGASPQIFGVAHLSLLLFKPVTDIFRLVAKMAADAVTFRSDALVPPLIESRHRHTAEECRDLLRGPHPVADRIGNSD
jgi:hypothetical protein